MDKPDLLYRSSKAAPGYENSANYKNATVDRLIDQGLSSSDLKVGARNALTIMQSMQPRRAVHPGLLDPGRVGRRAGLEVQVVARAVLLQPDVAEPPHCQVVELSTTDADRGLPESPPEEEAAPATGTAEQRRRSWLLRYVARRLLILVPLVLLVSVAAFTLTHAAPGGPIATLLEDAPTSPEQIEAIKAKYKLGEPLPVQYWDWLSGVLQGDFGRSIITNETGPQRDQLAALGDADPEPRGDLHSDRSSASRSVCSRRSAAGGSLDRVLVTISVFFMSTPVFALGLVRALPARLQGGALPALRPG